jgi:hypothetical protein
MLSLGVILYLCSCAIIAMVMIMHRHNPWYDSPNHINNWTSQDWWGLLTIACCWPLVLAFVAASFLSRRK